MPYFTVAQGKNVYFETYGEQGKPPVLLVHGLAANMRIWKPQIESFAECFTVYALDLPGHGKSDAWDEYSMQDIPSIIKEFLDFNEIDRIHLVGLSVGATASLMFAATHPERTLSLVLQGIAGGIHPLSHPMGWLGALQLTFTVYTVFALWRLLGRKRAGYVINWVGKTYKYAQLLTTMEETVDAKALKQYSYSNANAPYGNYLHRIIAPTLVIRGIKDQFAPVYSQYVFDRINALGLWVEVPNAHHLVSLERPLEFNLNAIAFIRKFENDNLAQLSHSLKDKSESVLHK